MQALQTRGVNVRSRRPQRGGTAPHGLPGASGTDMSKVMADPRPRDPFAAARREANGETFRYGTREAVRRAAVKAEQDMEYSMRLACGRARDEVRRLKGRGLDYRAAAARARNERATYVRRFGRDPFTLAPLDMTVRAQAAESSASNKVKAVD
jgi:hypothetical protein